MRDIVVIVVAVSYMYAAVVAFALLMAAVSSLAVKAKRLILASAIGKRIKNRCQLRTRPLTADKKIPPLGFGALDDATQPGLLGCATFMAVIISLLGFLAWLLIQVDAFGLARAVGKPPLWTGLFFLPVALLIYLPQLQLPDGLAHRRAQQLLSFTVSLFRFAGFLVLAAGLLFLLGLILHNQLRNTD